MAPYAYLALEALPHDKAMGICHTKHGQRQKLPAESSCIDPEGMRGVRLVVLWFAAYARTRG